MASAMPHDFILLLFGPKLVGSHLAAALWGVSCLQTYSFLRHGRNRTAFHRSTVLFLLTLNTFNAVLNVHIPFYHLISEYGNPRTSSVIAWSFSTFIISSEISNFLIRVLFARCVWLFSARQKWVPSWIVAISFVTLGFTIAFGILLLLHPDAQALEYSPEPLYNLERVLIIVASSGGFIANCSVAIALCYYLYIATTETLFTKTKSLVGILMKYIVSTGLIVSIISLLQMVFHLMFPLTGVGTCFFFLASKLYFNSYLAMLNSRDEIRGRVEETGQGVPTQVQVRLGAAHGFEGVDSMDGPVVDLELARTDRVGC